MVKAFNAIGAQHMANPWFGGQSASMFLCGDDSTAKRTVAGLADALGFEPVDVGPLVQARLLEPLAMLWTSMAYAYVQESVGHRVPEGRCRGCSATTCGGARSATWSTPACRSGSP